MSSMEYVAKKLSMTEVQVIEVQNKTPESMYCTIGLPKIFLVKMLKLHSELWVKT